MEGERMASNGNLAQSPNVHMIEGHNKFSYAVHTVENSL